MNSDLALHGKTPIPLKEREGELIHPRRVIVIAGPTASGKTRLSLELAKVLDGEIISADSMQVYRGMDIGTAKVAKQQRDIIPHHLIDVRDISEPFNVVDFCGEATAACENILQRHKVPIVVGGTGFYIHSFIYGPPEGPPASQELRDQLTREIDKYGTERFYEKLKELDPEYAETISHGDKSKMIRALEIITLTQKKVSDFQQFRREEMKPLHFDFRPYFIYLPRESLYPKIENRCDQMLDEGFCQEVEILEERGLRNNITASQAIGYRQYLEYMDTARTKEDWERFVKGFKQASRRYAKRQFTWFRKEPLFEWINLDNYRLQEVVEMIVDQYI